MKVTLLPVMCTIGLSLLTCFGGAKSLKLGECPLTITVKAEGKDFDGYANVYINEKYIGTTDSKTKVLKISLGKGEYNVWVTADGYETWQGKILLLGEGYKQNVLARLKKSTLKNKNTPDIRPQG